MDKPDYEVQYVAEGPNRSPSILQLFGTDKASIAMLAAKLVQEVKEGRLNSLDVATFAKRAEIFLEHLHEGLKPDYRSEALKYGEKPFDYNGAEIQACDVRVEYDYSKCNHPHLNEKRREIAEKTEECKQLESMLKMLPGPQVLVLDGEAVEVKPPTVKRTGGIKIKIK